MNILPQWFRNGISWLWRNLRFGRTIRYALLAGIVYLAYNNTYKDISAALIEQKYGYDNESGKVNIDGTTVYFRKKGKGDPVILLHNANSSSHTWAAWVDTLSTHYQVFVPDLPGHGLTGPHSRGSYSLFMYVDFLDSFANALNLKTFHLAGNGLGAEIAWFYASEHNERIKKLILLDPPGLEESHNSIFDQIASTPVINRVYWYLTPPALYKVRLERIFADDQLVTDQMVERHFDLSLREGNRKAYTDRIAVSDNRPPAQDMIKKITVPTLVMWGAEDPIISPSHAYEFHKKLRNADLRIYTNTGHWPQEENPKETAKDALGFLNGTF